MCSNHFVDGKPADDYGPPKLYLRKSDEQRAVSTTRSAPRERKSHASSFSDSDLNTEEIDEESLSQSTQSTQTDEIKN